VQTVCNGIGDFSVFMNDKKSGIQEIGMIGRVDHEELIKFERFLYSIALKPSLIKILFGRVDLIQREGFLLRKTSDWTSSFISPGWGTRAGLKSDSVIIIRLSIPEISRGWLLTIRTFPAFPDVSYQDVLLLQKPLQAEGRIKPALEEALNPGKGCWFLLTGESLPCRGHPGFFSGSVDSTSSRIFGIQTCDP